MTQRNYYTAEMKFDGGSRGNPGPAAAAAVVRFCDDGYMKTVGKYIGEHSNNYAEYRALIEGLKLAREMGVKRLIIFGDSNLVVNHVNGRWACNVDELKDSLKEAKGLLNGWFVDWEISHVPRSLNRFADEIATQVLDAHKRREKERSKVRR